MTPVRAWTVTRPDEPFKMKQFKATVIPTSVNKGEMEYTEVPIGSLPSHHPLPRKTNPNRGSYRVKITKHIRFYLQRKDVNIITSTRTLEAMYTEVLVF